jgi:hypothetical protein
MATLPPPTPEEIDDFKEFFLTAFQSCYNSNKDAAAQLQSKAAVDMSDPSPPHNLVFEDEPMDEDMAALLAKEANLSVNQDNSVLVHVNRDDDAARATVVDTVEDVNRVTIVPSHPLAHLSQPVCGASHERSNHKPHQSFQAMAPYFGQDKGTFKSTVEEFVWPIFQEFKEGLGRIVGPVNPCQIKTVEELVADPA